jgi:hypothetical protein
MKGTKEQRKKGRKGERKEGRKSVSISLPLKF